MTINQALSKARQIMKNHSELRYWTVTYNKRKSAFGVCNHSYRQIELSAYLVPVMTDDAIVNTIIHEIAHALTPGHHHDPVWRAKCIELGGDGKRCNGAENYKGGLEGAKIAKKNIYKYTLSCPYCDNVVFMNRRPKVSRSCGNHGSRVFDPKYKMILKQNY